MKTPIKKKIIKALSKVEIPEWVTWIAINKDTTIYGYRNKPYNVSTETKKQRKEFPIRPSKSGVQACVELCEAIIDGNEYLVHVRDL